MKASEQCQLYTFVDTAYLRGRDPAEIARQLCDGGSDVIQFRAKDLSKVSICAMATQILAITEAASVPLVINDHPDVAREIGAPLVHLGQEDFFDGGFKHTSEFSPLQVGLSTHSPEQAERALAAKPAYIAIGPVYATGTKPTAKPVTLDYVRWAAQNVSIPWFAIGGITLDNIDHVIAAGARRVCVVSAILNAENVAKACQAFRKRLLSAAL